MSLVDYARAVQQANDHAGRDVPLPRYNPWTQSTSVWSTNAPRGGDVMGTSVNHGADRQDEKLSDAVILFADVVGSARLSDVLHPHEYDEIIREFQQVASGTLRWLVDSRDAFGRNWIVDGAVRGDELVLILCVGQQDSDDEMSIALLDAIRVTVRLSAEWLASKTNQERIDNSAPPHGLCVGLHVGPVVVRERERGCTMIRRDAFGRHEVPFFPKVFRSALPSVSSRPPENRLAGSRFRRRFSRVVGGRAYPFVSLRCLSSHL